MMITELGILDNVCSSDRLLCILRVVDLKKINKIKTPTISEVLQRPSTPKSQRLCVKLCAQKYNCLF